MLKCNLAVLLAERNLKITKVSRDTGISRTTLTSLANNYSQGIQFETLDTLCAYLKITPADFFCYSPFKVLVKVEKAVGGESEFGKFNIRFIVTTGNGQFIAEFLLSADARFSKGFSIDEFDSEIETKFLNIVVNVSESDTNRHNYKSFIQQLPPLLKNELESDICNLFAIEYDYGERIHTEIHIVWN